MEKLFKILTAENILDGNHTKQNIIDVVSYAKELYEESKKVAREDKIFITCETINNSFLGGPSTSEFAYVSSIDKLPVTIDLINRNKHKVIRVVRGHEVEFKNDLIITDKIKE